MRLIDADKLILHLNDYALQESPSNVESADDRKISRAVYKAITDCIEAVDEQPTAFDVDKVVEQLEEVEKIMTSPVTEDCFGEKCRASDCTVCLVSKAIEIVKGGGVE